MLSFRPMARSRTDSALTSSFLSQLRQVKHIAFVTRKQARFLRRRVRDDFATWAFAAVRPDLPFAYSPERYRNTFLANTISLTSSSSLPERVFCLWTGDNPLTDNRRRSLRALQDSIGMPLVFVTRDNLDEWLVDGRPLHPAYKYLSLVHRSDYLRGYLMHHHGGGYVDIKRPLHSWRESYERMAVDLDAWVASYSSIHANWVAKVPGVLGIDILRRYRSMPGMGAFMMRSHTPLTAEWLAEMDRRLDEHSDALQRRPGEVRGVPGYPLSWHDLLGRILHPLTLKYHAHVRYDEDLLLDFENYI